MKKSIGALLFIFLLCSCGGNTVDIDTSITGPVLHVDKKSVKNGETIRLTTDISGTKNGEPIQFTVTYYWNNKEIGSSNDNTTKYHIDYKIDNQSVGYHELSCKSEYKSSNTTSLGTAIINIEVVQ